MLTRYFKAVLNRQSSVLPTPHAVPDQPIGEKAYEPPSGSRATPVQCERIRSENGQGAVGRRTDADITDPVPPLACAARAGVGVLLVERHIDIGVLRSRSIGELHRIRIKPGVESRHERPSAADRLRYLEANGRLVQPVGRARLP